MNPIKSQNTKSTEKFVAFLYTNNEKNNKIYRIYFYILIKTYLQLHQKY